MKDILIEAVEKEYPIYKGTSEIDKEYLINQRRQFEKGAKWQEKRMYSREEVEQLIEKAFAAGILNKHGMIIDKIQYELERWKIVKEWFQKELLTK